ncbi:hypothetical protein B1218_36945, partial [Pseudomonas ogarae]
ATSRCASAARRMWGGARMWGGWAPSGGVSAGKAMRKSTRRRGAGARGVMVRGGARGGGTGRRDGQSEDRGGRLRVGVQAVTRNRRRAHWRPVQRVCQDA